MNFSPDLSRPNHNGNLKLPDPTLPPGTEIFSEEGIGVHKFHIEITSR